MAEQCSYLDTMSKPRMPSESPRLPHDRRPRLSWAAVAGFGVLGLLWPLLRLVGAELVIGGPATALAAFLVTFVMWALGAGFGNVPRPVLTLSLSGVIFGLLLGATTLLIGDWPDYGIGLNLLGGVIEVGRSAGLGALAGLVAELIQKTRRR